MAGKTAETEEEKAPRLDGVVETKSVLIGGCLIMALLRMLREATNYSPFSHGQALSSQGIFLAKTPCSFYRPFHGTLSIVE